MSTTTICTAFMTDVAAGDPLPVSSSAAGANPFRAFISNMLFVETLEEADDASINKTKNLPKKSSSGEEEAAVRVALLAQVSQERGGKTTSDVVTLASVVFPPSAQMPSPLAPASSSSRSSTKRREDAGVSESLHKKTKRVKRSRSETKEEEEEEKGSETAQTMKEIVWASQPLRSPLVFRHEKKKRVGAMRVLHLSVALEAVEPQTGVRRGRYNGSRSFLVRLSGVQDTEVSAEQVEMVRKMA